MGNTGDNAQEGHSTAPRKGSVRGAGCVAGARQAITAASLGKSLQGASSKSNSSVESL